MKYFSPTLLGLSTTAALVASPFASARPALALTGPEINQIAQTTSVHIARFTQNGEPRGSGSGFIISRDGNKYYVATNAHVVGDFQTFGLRMHDGEMIVANNAKKFRGLDLAVIEFESNRSYDVATLAPTVEVGQDVFVSGWPPPHPSSNETVRQFMYGRVSADLEQNFNYGYEIAYSAPTDVGMSGGQVIDASGRVVAIHGMGGPMTKGAIAQRIGASNPDDPLVQILAQATNSGLNYGIPISTFINQAAANGVYLDLAVSREAPQSLGAPIADSRNADPTSPKDRVEDAYASLAIIRGTLNTIEEGHRIICGIFGC